MRAGLIGGWVAVAAAALVALDASVPSSAVADGDPASDFLVGHRVFVPFQDPNPILVQQLTTLVREATRNQFPIKVAVIQARQDLGANPQLLGKPEIYARFLGAELRWRYRNALLVVMVEGYGYTRTGRPVRGSARAVAELPRPAGNSPDDLTRAAIAALRRLAAASGHPLPPAHPALVAGPRSSPSRSFLADHPVAIAVASISVAGFCATVALLVVARLRGWG
jgi:hypothetical protein